MTQNTSAISQSPKKISSLVLILLTFALFLRIGYFLFLEKNYFFFEHPASDVSYYQNWAYDIANGDWLGQGVFMGLPLYPYFLAFLIKLTNGNTFLIHLSQILLGTANCYLAFELARRVFNQKTAIITLILMSINFLMIYYSWLLMPVTLLTFLSLLLLIGLTNEKFYHSKYAVLIGLLMGVMCAGDGKLFIFWFLLTGYFFYQKHKTTQQHYLKTAFIITISMFVVVFAITLRNKIVGGNWALITGQTGLSFYVGNSAEADGLYSTPEFIRPHHEGQDEDQSIYIQFITGQKPDAATISKFWRKKTLNFIQTSPQQYVILLLKKIRLFFSDVERAHDIDLLHQGKWRKRLDWNPYYLMFPLAVIGFFISRRENNQKLISIDLIILSQFFFTLIFFLTTRHRATILPFLMIYEAFFLCWFLEQIKIKKYKTLIPFGIFITIFITIFKPIPIDPKTISFIQYANAGPVYSSRGDHELAQLNYKKALEIDPTDTNTIYNLAASYQLQEKFDLAEHNYKRVLHTIPDHVDALFNLGHLYHQTNRSNEALAIFNKLLTLQPTKVDIYFQLAAIHEELGNCDSSKKYIQQILQIDPRFAEQLKNYKPLNCQ